MPTAVSGRSIDLASTNTMRRVVHSHRWLIASVLAYAAAGLGLAASIGLAGQMSLLLYSAGVAKIFLGSICLFALGYPIWVMLMIRPANLFDFIHDDLRTNYLTFERLFQAVIVLLVLPVFTSVFTSIKLMIPVLVPFHWDPEFAAWDRWLHGGVHPWELLHPLLGTPLVTTGVNAVYHLWFFVLYAVIFWQAFSRWNPRLRMQFFLSFVLSWSLLGSLAALLLSSGGPPYFGELVGGADPYAPLLAYLREADLVSPVWALGVQDMLWSAYRAGGLHQGGGISAMPSMHVSAVTLFVLLAWRVRPWLGWIFAGFAVSVFIGSIHLAWHYAIDGYVAVVATLLVWRVCGRIVARDPAFDAN